MSSAVSNLLAGLILAITLLTSIVSCGIAPSESQTPTPNNSPQPAATGQKRGAKDDRVAIPEIKGCPRDQTSFYKGKVLAFKRGESSVEITIRTDWETTEKLEQANKDNSIEFRRKGQPINDNDWKEIESRLSDPKHQLTATVWVCQPGGKDQIKIIDWEPPASEGSDR